MLSKICAKCGKEFPKPYYSSQRTWEKRKYCSLDCRKNDPKTCIICGTVFRPRGKVRKLTAQFCSLKCAGVPNKGKIPPNLEQARANSPVQKGNTLAKALKGKPRPPFSEEWLKNMGQAFRKTTLNKGENHWNWKGGITEENHKIRTSSDYKDWRMKVFQRDRFSCVECGYRSKVERDIVADHIQPFSLFPELRFDVNNGRTLCRPCDKKVGFNNFRGSQGWVGV